MYVYIYVCARCIHTDIHRFIYRIIYRYTHIQVNRYIHIYIHTHTERERDIYIYMFIYEKMTSACRQRETTVSTTDETSGAPSIPD